MGEHAIDKVCDACDVCASSVRSYISKKLSISPLNEGFNTKVKVDS